MNIDYLYSIIDLYLKKEDSNKRTIVNVKKLDDNVEFNFNMKKDTIDKTSFIIPLDINNKYLVNYLNMYKEDLLIIDEKYSYYNASNTCYYYVLFKNGRTISFDGFTISEMNNIRNILYNINYNKEELRVTEIEEEKEMAYKPRLRLAEAGFSSYATLFLVVCFFALVLVIALLIFNSFLN